MPFLDLNLCALTDRAYTPHPVCVDISEDLYHNGGTIEA